MLGDILAAGGMTPSGIITGVVVGAVLFFGAVIGLSHNKKKRTESIRHLATSATANVGHTKPSGEATFLLRISGLSGIILAVAIVLEVFFLQGYVKLLILLISVVILGVIPFFGPLMYSKSHKGAE